MIPITIAGMILVGFALYELHRIKSNQREIVPKALEQEDTEIYLMPPNTRYCPCCDFLYTGRYCPKCSKVGRKVHQEIG